MVMLRKCSVVPMSWPVCLVVAVTMMLMLGGGVHGCFIRNCPRGGKRALDATRQCMACGPEGAGQCVGPDICCGPGLGCLLRTPETEVCQKENESSTPCTVRGRQCGLDNTGNCVADGICCVEDACSFNSLCQSSDQEESSSTRHELLTLIRRLLVNRQYD